MKKATLQIILIMLFAPFILAQTTHRYLENFDSGNAEGWVFYTDASVSVQNGQLKVQSSSPDFQIAHIYPPLCATVNDFSIDFSTGANSIAEGGFVGRIGFNSLIGVLFQDDTMKVVYATDISNFYEPNFIDLYTQRVYDYTASGKIEVAKSGADLIVKSYLNDTLRFSGNIQNAPASLSKGHLIISVVGEQLDWTLSHIDFKYNPYITNTSGTYTEDFTDNTTPWYKYGSWDKVGQAITISNGNLNMNYTGTDFVSLYVGTPVGSVENFEMAVSLAGPTVSGRFGIWRVYSLKYYSGLYYDGDTLIICYQGGGSGEPIVISQIGIDLNQFSTLKLRCERNGTNLTFVVSSQTSQILSGTLTTADKRLYAGHLITGFDTEDNLSMYFSDATIQYTMPVTGIEDESVPNQFNLAQNYPNPFNPETVIRYALPAAGEVVITVYNLLGQKVKTLVDGYKEAGEHQIMFKANDLPGGVYLYELRSGTYITARKMVLLK